MGGERRGRSTGISLLILPPLCLQGLLHFSGDHRLREISFCVRKTYEKKGTISLNMEKALKKMQAANSLLLPQNNCISHSGSKMCSE